MLSEEKEENYGEVKGEVKTRTVEKVEGNLLSRMHSKDISMLKKEFQGRFNMQDTIDYDKEKDCKLEDV